MGDTEITFDFYFVLITLILLVINNHAFIPANASSTIEKTVRVILLLDK